MHTLGIEFGSTRIKAVVVDNAFRPVLSGDFTWKSRHENGYWTYGLDEVWTGLRAAVGALGEVPPLDAMGVSGMMHGYLAFDKDWNLLVPFRTWQNTTTAPAAAELTGLLGFTIPQRWSVAHLYQAILDGEPHVKDIAHITTLAGYVHFMLTGENVLGVGEASGMFPIDSARLDYDAEMLGKFEALVAPKGFVWNIRDILPRVLNAGESAGFLTAEGAARLGGVLPAGIPFAPPEGDAGTGMVATNSVAPRTGNVSAGTSIFSMVVLERPLRKVRTEINLVTTPDGSPVAMVHGSNCTSDLNAWAGVFREAAALFGAEVSDNELFTKLYTSSLAGDADCGGIVVCNYIAGEGVTHFDEGRPFVLRSPDARFTLPNFFRATLYASIATLAVGMDFLAEEKVAIDRLTGHGGLFKTPGVGQSYLAAACGAPVTCMETAGEGGPYGIALLAAYRAWKTDGESLGDFLSKRVFANAKSSTLAPDAADREGFHAWLFRFREALAVEKAAIQALR